MEDDFLVAVASILFVDEFDGVSKRGDGGFDRGFDIAALQPKPVNLALHILQPGLALLQQQV